MKIAIGCDHGALEFKNQIKEYLQDNGYFVTDFGTNTLDSCDYPDYAFEVANDVAKGNSDYGIVMCTTGIGVSIACNKVKGIRCALVDRVDFAKLTKEHNDANVLAMGAKAVTIEYAKEIVKTFLETPFSNNERHLRRVNKIKKYEGAL